VDDENGLRLFSVTANLVVIVIMVWLAIMLLPLFTATVLQLLPIVVIIWFILMVVRGIIQMLLH
jgi:hypothetical protein